MRLNVKHKQSLSKTPKQKKANLEKKSKGPKLASNYTDNSDYEGDDVTLDMTQTRYGVLRCCDADALETPEGVIKLEKSWVEAILIMLSTVITNYKDTFQNLLEENNVASLYVVVDKTYGKYSFTQEQYRAYNVFNTGYYLEIVESPEVLFNTIVGLIKCIGLHINEVKFHVRNKVYKNITLDFTMLKENEHIATIKNIMDMLDKGMHIIAINLFDEVQPIHRLDVALVAFCNKCFDEYGIVRLNSLPKYESTGIKIVEDDDIINENITIIRDSEICVYTDGDNKGIVKFISDSMKLLDIGDNKFKFKLKEAIAKQELKEWEIE